MVFHITQGLADKYAITMADKLPKEDRASAMYLLKIKKWDPLTAWGVKGFDFRGVTCFQIMNFASKLAFFVFNVDKGNEEQFGRIMWEYLSMLYEDNKEMMAALEEYFRQNRYSVYTPLLDKPALASLVSNERIFTNGDKIEKFIEKGVLQTKKLNWEYNKGYLVARVVGGRTEFIVPADRFKDLLLDRFGQGGK